MSFTVVYPLYLIIYQYVLLHIPHKNQPQILCLICILSAQSALSAVILPTMQFIT